MQNYHKFTSQSPAFNLQSNINTKQSQQLPYNPLAFILTQTIGMDNQQKTQSISNSQLPLDYKYTYKDILIPVNISNLNRGDTQMLYLYYLYHIAPIYNWLREIKVVGEIKNDTGIDQAQLGRMRGGCFQRVMLGDYIKGSLIYKKDQKGFKELLNQSIFSAQNIMNNLKFCSTKFEVVKKCLMCKIFITKTSPDLSSTSAIISTKINNAIQSNVLNICKHNLKLSLISNAYHYQKQTKQFIVTSYYCKQCQRNIQISKNQYKVQQYPFAPIFTNYYGETITIKTDVTNKKNNNTKSVKQIIYKLCLIYTGQYVVIKGANQLWYRGFYGNTNNNKNTIVNGDMKIQNFSNFNLEKQVFNKKINGLFVYAREQMSKNCGILRLAAPLKQKSISSPSKEKSNIKNHKQVQNFKGPQTVKVQHYIKPTDKKQQHKMNQHKYLKQFQNNIMEVLTQLQAHSQVKRHVLHQNILSSGQSKQYQQEVQKLYIKPKEKDQYEKQYDRGKTKKIKKKVQYIKPNFNAIFKQVKVYNKQLIQGKREPERGKKKNVQNNTNQQKGSLNFRNNKNKLVSNHKGGNKKGNFGRQTTKKWKKKEKQQFVKKFQQS